MMTQRTHTEIAQAIADRDRAHTVAGRLAELVTGGCDYDEMTQRLTDTYAEWLGISEDDHEDYEAICEIANEHMAQEMTDNDEDLIAEISEEWADYWEGEEWDNDSILTEDLIADITDLVAQGLSVSEAVVIVAQAQ